MLSRIENLWRLSVATFFRSADGAYGFNDEMFTNLKKEMDNVTSSDICLEESLSERSHGLESKTGGIFSGYRANAPVTFIDVYSGPSFSICIFVLHKGSRMPIHDHPSMHGILKVLSGEVNIDSYTVLHQEQSAASENHGESFIAEKTSTILRASDPACVLTPKEKNLHAISPLNGSAAFMDILSPPYYSRLTNVPPNPCNFYKEASLTHTEDSKIFVKLIRVQPQGDYWCDKAIYKGPAIPMFQV